MYDYGAGSPVGTLTPDYRGQRYWDTTNGVFYISTGITNAKWVVTACEDRSYASATPTTEVPICIGQMWYVTDTKKIYKAACMTDNTCWQLLN
jgi:hypothetical protein